MTALARQFRRIICAMPRASLRSVLLICTFNTECPFCVISDRYIQRQRPLMSAVTPIADKRGWGWNVRYVPESDMAHMSPGLTLLPGLQDTIVWFESNMPRLTRNR